MINKEKECNPPLSPGYTKVTLLKDQDLARCFTMLDSLKLGEILELSKIPEASRDVFISCCKQYFKTYDTVIFNNGYTKIKKIYSFSETIKNSYIYIASSL